jgi:hypothetical protein
MSQENVEINAAALDERGLFVAFLPHARKKVDKSPK